MSDLKGKTLLNRYHVRQMIGRGGMAEVYEVWDQQRSASLAMKVLNEDLAIDRVFMRRFKREAQTLAKLQHPHIVRFYGLHAEGPLTFMLLDFIDGRNLKRVIYDAGGPLPADQIRTIVFPVLGALSFAHDQGMVHCDVKPGNIMITNQDNVLLADFGIARMSDAATVTLVGAGTPAYMAPEQIKGHDPLPQTDIYALGIVLYEMVTGGERPFTGESAATTGSTREKLVWEQLNLPPPSPRQFNTSLSPELEAVILRCLEKDPAMRYANALELRNALEHALGQSQPGPVDTPLPLPGEPLPPAHPDPSPPGLVKPKLSQPVMFVALGLIAVFVALIAFGGQPTAPGTSVPPASATPQAASARAVLPSATPRPVTKTMAAPAPASEKTAAPVSLSKNGKIAFVSERDGNFEIYVMDHDGSNQTRLTTNSYSDSHPSWSPDGRHIVYYSRKNGNFDIFVMDADGGNKRQLTTDTANDKYPSWSPDGKLIAFQSERSGNSDIYLISPTGKNLTRITVNSGTDEFPEWSPSSNQIVFQSTMHGNEELYIYDLNTASTTRVTQNSAYDGAPSWSPDSRKIAFHSNRSGNWEIYIMDVNGKNVTRLTDYPYDDWSPAWSPDGKQIVFYSYQGGNLEIVTINSNGTSMTQLTDNNAIDSFPDWGP
ncbi:MAG: protein kinase [Anaerolineae bacterium]|nr:protein kinase [Anaerolineae bacterium]